MYISKIYNIWFYFRRGSNDGGGLVTSRINNLDENDPHHRGSRNHLDAHPSSFDETTLRFENSKLESQRILSQNNPKVEDRHLLHLQNVIQHDSSSERDSGTGDSRKSRDNLGTVSM